MTEAIKSYVRGARGSDLYALTFKRGEVILDVTEIDDGIAIKIPRYLSGADPGGDYTCAELDATHTRELGKFLVNMFMLDATDNIRAIEERVAFAIGKLEVWNQRAREDEEHPPYDDITTNLHDIQRCLDELKKGVG